MTTNELIWSDPPPRKGGAGARVAPYLSAIDERPGQWAQLPLTVLGQSVAHWRKRFPDYEFTSRSIPGEKKNRNVWARRKP